LRERETIGEIKDPAGNIIVSHKHSRIVDDSTIKEKEAETRKTEVREELNIIRAESRMVWEAFERKKEEWAAEKIQMKEEIVELERRIRHIEEKGVKDLENFSRRDNGER